LKLVRFFKPAGLAVCIFLSFFAHKFVHRVSFCTYEGCSAASELSPDDFSGGGWCLFCCIRLFRTASSMLFTSISCNLALFGKLSWKVNTQKSLFQISAPIQFWAPARSRIVDPATKDSSWGSGKRHPGDVACASNNSTIVISAEGLNGKALKEAGR
jgi:hypothetical protein